MMLVQLPVTGLSRKILLAEYGSDPIKLTIHDLLFQQLCYHRILKESNTSRLKGTLRATVGLCLNGKLAKRVTRNGAQLGYHLYLYHRRLMMNYIEAQTGVGIPAKYALQNFYNEYDITEDDFDQETAYKYWHRHKARKKTKIVWTKEYCSVVLNYKKLTPAEAVRISQSSEVVPRIIECFKSNCFDKISSPPKQLLTHLHIYLQVELCCKRVGAVAREMKIHKNSVYYAVKVINSYLDTDPVISQSLKYCYSACL